MLAILAVPLPACSNSIRQFDRLSRAVIDDKQIDVIYGRATRTIKDGNSGHATTILGRGHVRSVR
jgi:hypothetical protein